MVQTSYWFSTYLFRSCQTARKSCETNLFKSGGRGHGRGISTGRGTGGQQLHAAHAAAVGPSGSSSAGESSTGGVVIPSLSAEQWETFRALLASVKDAPSEKLSGNKRGWIRLVVGQGCADLVGNIRGDNGSQGGLAPTAQRTPILQSSSSLPTVSAHPADSSSTADAQPMLSAAQPELPSTTAEIQQAVSSTESAPVLGRGQRQRTPNVRLSDCQTYAITHGVSPAIPNWLSVGGAGIRSEASTSTAVAVTATATTIAAAVWMLTVTAAAAVGPATSASGIVEDGTMVAGREKGRAGGRIGIQVCSLAFQKKEGRAGLKKRRWRGLKLQERCLAPHVIRQPPKYL
ncbi:unnamed protein product [Cuscuta campestris]|uniref:Uncharacterized protein n=1 Tax=Cuscuta campestris TaxID=132261 RepID=A0A484M4N5_9ASTE|nr:unnamed protein product [Cuscuta campestris]